jgi:hypothetical protein
VIATLDALLGVANRTGRPVSEVFRQHFLDAVLRRLPAREEPELVLRGSAIVRVWVAPFPRLAGDLDFLGTYSYSVDETLRQFRLALEIDAGDDVVFDVMRCRARPIWQESAFPGVRLNLVARVLGERHTTTIDVGFGDPLIPAAERVSYPWQCGGAGPVWAAAPATMASWKLHGLAEWGPLQWRPKDLLDLWLLLCRFSFAPATLAEAIRAAFESRGYAVRDARQTLDDPVWESFAAQSRWFHFRQERREAPIPESLSATRDAIRARLLPTLDLLPS